jgi:hypothetical protein
VNPAILSLAAVLTVSSLEGCSAQQAYSTGQAWQRNQCQKIPDKAEFERCAANAAEPYETYKAKSEGTVK